MTAADASGRTTRLCICHALTCTHHAVRCSARTRRSVSSPSVSRFISGQRVRSAGSATVTALATVNCVMTTHARTPPRVVITPTRIYTHASHAISSYGANMVPYPARIVQQPPARRAQIAPPPDGASTNVRRPKYAPPPRISSYISSAHRLAAIDSRQPNSVNFERGEIS